MTPQILKWARNVCSHADSVIETGAYNVNGTLRTSITHKAWFGTDERPGPGVDFVIPGEDLQHYFWNTHDLWVCAETLEHCKNWRAVLVSGFNTVAPGGLALITTPGHDFPSHDYPNDYQRFSIDIWRQVFCHQHILRVEKFLYPHEGNAVLVRKIRPADELDLDVQTLPVP